MSVLAVDGDFTPTFVFGPPAHQPCKDFYSGCLASFRALGGGFCSKFFGSLSLSDRLPLLTCLWIFQRIVIVLEGFPFKKALLTFSQIRLCLCSCQLILFLIIISINLSVDINFTICGYTVPWFPLGSFWKLVSDFPLSNNQMPKCF